MAPPLATLLTAGLVGLVFLWLTFRVVARRVSGKIMIGDGGDTDMLARIRAHANFVEHVPLTLLLMGGLEMTGAVSARWLLGAGLLLVAARIAHGIGMSLAAPNPFRAFGALASWLLIAALAGAAIWQGLAAIAL